MTDPLSSVIYMTCGEPSRATADEYLVGVPRSTDTITGQYNGTIVELDIRALLNELLNENAGRLSPEDVAQEADKRGYI